MTQRALDVTPSRASCAGNVLRRSDGKNSLTTVWRSSCQCRRFLDTSVLVLIPQRLLVRQQPSRQDLGLQRVVPRPFLCHERAEPLSTILFGALVQLSADRLLLPPIWRHRWRNIANHCVFARMVPQKLVISTANAGGPSARRNPSMSGLAKYFGSHGTRPPMFDKVW